MTDPVLTDEQKQEIIAEFRANIFEKMEKNEAFEFDDLFLPDGTFALKPLGDRIYITIPEKEEEKRTFIADLSLPTESGSYKDTARALVLAVGDGLVTVDDDGKVHRIPVQVQPGDWILLPEQDHAKVRFLGVEVGLTQEQRILSILNPVFIGAKTEVINITPGFGNPDINEANRAPGYL